MLELQMSLAKLKLCARSESEEVKVIVSVRDREVSCTESIALREPDVSRDGEAQRGVRGEEEETAQGNMKRSWKRRTSQLLCRCRHLPFPTPIPEQLFKLLSELVDSFIKLRSMRDAVVLNESVALANELLKVLCTRSAQLRLV